MTEVIVIGGGPAGATAAFTLARQGLPVRLVDPLGIGGQLINVEHVPDYPGFPSGVAGWDLAASLGEAVLGAGVQLTLGRVTGLRVPAHGATAWVVDIDGARRTADAVLLATGTKPTPLPGGEGLDGHGVSYCAACDGGLFHGKDVIVVGGGDIAMAEACSLAPLVHRVTVAVPGPAPDAAKAWLDAARSHTNVELLHGAIDLVVEQDDGRVSGVSYRDGDGVRRTIPAGGVFGGLPGQPAVEPAAAFAVTGDDGGLVADPSLRLGSLPGLFVAGDVRAGSARRAVSAAGDGATAAMAIAAYLL